MARSSDQLNVVPAHLKPCIWSKATVTVRQDQGARRCGGVYPPWRLSVEIRLALQPQAAVEPDHQVIVAIDMNNQPSDVVQLLSMLEA